MAIKQDIAAEKIRIGKVLVRSKLGRLLKSNIFDPLLDELDNEISTLYDKIGEEIVNRLRENIMNSMPAGEEYAIVEVVESTGGKNEYVVVGTHQASAPGQPPATFSGTLLSSIDFEIMPDGRIQVGIFESPGTEQSYAYLGRNQIVMNDNSPTSVVDYAQYLDKGVSGRKKFNDIAPRPWFNIMMQEMKPLIRERVKESLKKVRDKRTRSKSRNALYFRVYFRGVKQEREFDDFEE